MTDVRPPLETRLNEILGDHDGRHRGAPGTSNPYPPHRLRPHRFVEDPELEDNTTRRKWCMCGLPENNRIHPKDTR